VNSSLGTFGTNVLFNPPGFSETVPDNTVMQDYVIRKRVLIVLLIVTPLGFLFKFYAGPGKWWFNNYGAGLLYEVFWIIVIFLFIPKKQYVRRIPISVFVVTCALEVLQLWHPWLLQEIRSYFLGRALIGTSFVWWDFPHYVIGCVLGWMLIKWIVGMAEKRTKWSE
jgi:hypothetical protein